MVAVQSDELIRYYGHYLGFLGDEPEMIDAESWNVLIARDDLEDRWDELSQEQQETVRNLDQILIHKHAVVAEVLPTRVAHDRRRWWWFLHEGPQVKEQAEAASTR